MEKNIQKIKENWNTKPVNKEATKEFWDIQAQRKSYMEIPQFEENLFLQLLDKEGMLQPEYNVLDIGCGAGAYSLAIASRVHEVVGTDLSEQMIQNANLLLAENQDYSNVAFQVDNWSELSLEDCNWKEKFDLVFAHMTPAIADLDCFKKLIAASKKHCVIAKPTRRSDSILDKVKELVGLKQNPVGGDTDIRNMFDYLWLEGYNPKFLYEPVEWYSKYTLEEAYTYFMVRMRQFMELTEADEDKIRKYLCDIAIEDIIEETIQTQITTIYWDIR